MHAGTGEDRGVGEEGGTRDGAGAGDDGRGRAGVAKLRESLCLIYLKLGLSR